MKRKLWDKAQPTQTKKMSKTKTISYLAIIVAVLSIADQFLDWGVIDMLLRMLDR